MSFVRPSGSPWLSTRPSFAARGSVGFPCPSSGTMARRGSLRCRCWRPKAPRPLLVDRGFRRDHCRRSKAPRPLLARPDSARPLSAAEALCIIFWLAVTFYEAIVDGRSLRVLCWPAVSLNEAVVGGPRLCVLCWLTLVLRGHCRRPKAPCPLLACFGSTRILLAAEALRVLCWLAAMFYKATVCVRSSLRPLLARHGSQRGRRWRSKLPASFIVSSPWLCVAIVDGLSFDVLHRRLALALHDHRQRPEDLHPSLVNRGSAWPSPARMLSSSPPCWIAQVASPETSSGRTGPDAGLVKVCVVG